jgi:hypothetical protein
MQVNIYLMKDPDDLTIKYVGKTKETLFKRLQGHISYALRKKHLKGKHDWLRKLYYNNQLPIIELIEECEESVWREREIYWIDFYSVNNNLFNRTSGGEDFVFKSGNNPWNKGGGIYSDESRKRMSEASKGRKFSIETRRKLSEIKKGKKLSPQCYEAGRQLCIKQVLLYDIEGNFLREFESVTEAAEILNSHTNAVSWCCNGKVRIVKGYICRYKTENYPLKIEVNLPKGTLTRAYKQLNKNNT